METDAYSPQVREAANAFISKAIERNGTDNPLHLAEIALVAAEKCGTWFQDLRDLILADGRLQQQGNSFIAVPGVDLSAPVQPNEGGVQAEHEDNRPEENPPSNKESATRPPRVWTSVPRPQTSEPISEEPSFLQYLSTNKAVRVGSVSSESQFLSFVQRFCDSCPPVSSFRSWWRKSAETGKATKSAEKILERLAYLQYVRLEVSETHSKKLIWDMNALAKYSAERATAAQSIPAPSWSPTSYGSDLQLVKKMIVHQLKAFNYYRIQNIYQIMTKKRDKDPSFDLNLYVDTLMHDIQKDKRFVLTKDDSGDPAIALRDVMKTKPNRQEFAKPLSHDQLVAEARKAAVIVKEGLEKSNAFQLNILRQNMLPWGVKDQRDWVDAVVSVLERTHNLRIAVDAEVLRVVNHVEDTNERKRRPDSRDDYENEGFYFRPDPEPKRRRLPEICQPEMEWRIPPPVELPPAIAQRSGQVETAEFNFQTNRAQLISQNVEIPYQKPPVLPLQRIALDFEE